MISLLRWALDYAVETANAVMDAESSDVLQPLIDQAKETVHAVCS